MAAVDPARDPNAPAPRPSQLTDMVKNMDIPASAFTLNEEAFGPHTLTSRPGYNTTGKDIQISLNSYPITQFPTKSVHQYDVLIGNGSEKRIVIQKVWDSKTRQEKLGKDFIFDGNKLAWSQKKLPSDVNVVVDLDAEQGRPPGKTPNTFRLVVRPTKSVNLQVVEEYVKGNTSFSKDALEGLNFLDHLLRETPSQKFLALKRSYFSESNAKQDLGRGVFAYKGIYQAVRVVHPGALAINIDVSNTCFWALHSLNALVVGLLNLRDIQELMTVARPQSDGNGGRSPSRRFTELSRLHKLVVKASYKGCPCADKEWTIKNFIPANAKEYMIDIRNKATGETQSMSIFDYFRTSYNVTLNYWQLPLVQMTKKGVIYPMEVLAVYTSQKYPYKLNDIQTSAMIKFSATRPGDRRKAVELSKTNLAHDSDPVLNAYGMKVAPQMMRSKARLLPNPEIMFGDKKTHNPGTTGRWDLRGKKFFAANSKPLASWGIGFFRGGKNPVNVAQAKAFGESFAKIYAGHGGKVTAPAHIMQVKDDAGDAVYDLFYGTGNKNKARPQLLIFVVNTRDSFHYSRIKKSCDCRFGVPSQVVQAQHVAQNKPQYISNVLMKVNARLGGTTARAVSKTPALRPYTMVIGADVSHAAPGSQSPSMAAMTMSMDPYGCRYLGACQTNGNHVEMISDKNIREMLTPLAREWINLLGKGKLPQYVYYFRDGVSEGQFQHVLQEEIPQLRALFKELNNGQEWTGLITVVIASKRHHVRAFVPPGDKDTADRNGNCVPGVLIERDVTDPHGWDFFLYSHVALQGTSRPVHYHVLLDESKHPPHVLENTIYEHCYQYMRSTTSISLFPAVYYAHLVSKRAIHHENIPASSGPQSNQQGPGGATEESRPLMPMAEGDRLALRMWYI